MLKFNENQFETIIVYLECVVLIYNTGIFITLKNTQGSNNLETMIRNYHNDHYCIVPF